MSAPAPSPDTVPSARAEDRRPDPVRRRRGWFARLMGLGLLGIAVLLGLLAGTLWWLGTDSGLRFVVGVAEDRLNTADTRLRIQDPSGSLYRGIRIGAFEYEGGGIAAKGTELVLRYHLRALLARQLHVTELTAASIDVQLPAAQAEAEPPPREPIPMPGSFALPVGIDLERFAIGRLTVVPGEPPAEPITITDLKARLRYAANEYRLDQLAATTPWGKLADADLRLGAEAPHPLVASLTFAGEVEQVAFDARLALDGDLEALTARLDGGALGADARIEARLQPLAVMPLSTGRVAITSFDVRRLAPLLAPETALPETALDATVTVDLRDAAAWQSAIQLTNRAAGSLAADRVPLQGLSARVEIQQPLSQTARVVDVRDLKLTAPAASAAAVNQAGAAASVTGTVRVEPGQTVTLAGFAVPRTRAALAFEAIDVAQFLAALPPTALGGQLTLDESAFSLDLRQTAARMKALLPPDLVAAAGDAEIVARGRLSEAVVTLDEARLRLGSTRLDASGEAGTGSPRKLALKGRLRGVELAQWMPANLAIEPRWRDGRINADWQVDGHLEPVLDARLTLALVDSRLAGQTLAANLRSHLTLRPDGQPARLADTHADLRLGRNQLRAEGALGRTGDRMRLNLSLSDPGALDSRLAGRLSLDGTVSGAFDRLAAQAAVRADRLRVQAPEGNIEVASVRLDANGPLMAVLPAAAPLGAKLAVRGLVLPAGKVDSVDLGLDGSLANHRFDLAARGFGESIQLTGTGRAVLDKAPQWTARLNQLTLAGTVPARLNGPTDLRVTADDLRLERFDATVLDGRLALPRLAYAWGGKPGFDVTGTLRDLPVARLLAMAGQKSDDALTKPLTALQLDGSWTLKGSGPADLDGEARVDLRENANQGGPGLGKDNGARLRFNRGQMQGQINLALPSLAFLRPVTGPDVEVDGALSLGGTLAGSVLAPRWDLRLTGKDLAILQRSAGWRLSDGVLAARLVDREVRIETVRLSSGEGKVEVSGQARLLDDPKAVPAGSLPIDGRFDLSATRFHVPIGPGQRVTLSGKTALISGLQGTTLGGELRADNGLIEIQGSSAPTLPADVQVIDTRPGAKPVVSKPAATKPADKKANGKQADEKPAGEPKSPIQIRTDLGIDLGEQLRLTGNGLAARLTGQLRLGGTLPDDPQMRGTVNVVEGAYRAYGQDLQIQKGIIRFNGPIDNPSLDIEANRPFLPVQVGVAITGTALSPTITLVSRPEMSQTDKLSWLVLGTDPRDAPAAAQSLLLQQAAINLLSDDDGSYKPGLAERLGLDVINFGYGSDIGPAQGVIESAMPTGLPRRESSTLNSTPQEVVTLGKRFGNRLFVSYEQGVRSVWNLLRLQYTLTERLSARLQGGSDNALDLLYSWSFD